MLDIDRKGLPGVAIFTEEFRSGVEAWRDVHGFDANAVYIDHPVQPLTVAELHDRAERVFDEVIAAITAR